MMEIWEEEGERDSEGRDGPGDVIGSDSVIDRIRNCPMFSPPRSLADQVQSPPLDLFGFQFGYEAYLPPATTTVCNIEASLGYEASLFGLQFGYEAYLPPATTTMCHFEASLSGLLKLESLIITECSQPEWLIITGSQLIITGSQLIITGSQLESVIITDCWQLESLIITDCWQLESLKITDCWQLELLIITHSQLESLIITRSQLESLIITDSMGSLTITDSQLESLIITDCSRLESIITGRSQLESFIITHCSRLESIITDGSQLESLIITDCSRMNSIITESLQLESLIITGCSQPEWDKSIDKPINAQASFLFHSALYSQACKLNFVGAQAPRIYLTVQCFIEKESNAQGFFLEGRYVEAYHRSDIKYFYQSIKKFMRWLDSSEEKMFGGLGVKYIEQKVERAEKSCITISHLKGKSTTERPKRRYRTTYLITLDDLRQLFGHKRADAAKTLGGCWIGAEMNHIVKFLKVEESNAQGYSLEGRCVKANNVMDEKLDSGVQTFERRPGVEIIQLDSSEERIFGELGAKNIGQKVESAEKSCIPISHSKKKNTIETPKRKYRTKRSITLDDLRPLFGQKRVDAAKTLGVSVPTFKRYCRQNGITWWNGDGCSPVEPKLLNNSVHQNSSSSKPPEVQGEKEISALLGARQDAVTIKAKYGEGIFKFQLSSESGFAELQEAVAKRLKSQAFIVEYEDEDQEPITIACDEDWQACVKFFGNQVIRLAIRDKISNAKKSHGSGRGLKRKRS